MCSRYLTLLVIILTHCTQIFSQEKIYISDIILEGNNKTQRKVILRELDIAVGNTVNLKNLEQKFTKNRLQLLSTGLFNEVKINLKDYYVSESTAKIEVIMEENWYLFPVPIFELADRNFNVWIKEQGAKLNRTNYGLRIGHYNFTGNRDPLKLKVHFGYTRKYEITYAYPYLYLDNKVGLAGSIFYSENREIAYKTENNKTLFHKMEDERKLLSRFRIGPELKYRPSIYSFHSLRFEYHHNKIDPFVATELNPEYFLDGRTDLRFLFLEYDYNYDRRAYSQYPQGGYLIFGNLKKEGLGIFNDFDNLSVQLGFEKHHKLTENVFISSRNKAKTNLTQGRVAFANNTGLGWDNDIVSGYDLYVMDGTSYFITINNIKWKFFDNNLNTVKWLPKQFRKMKFIAFLRLNLDAAIVKEETYTETNFLSNKWFYGGGPAMDLIFFNNFLFSFEYSFNDLGERGLFINNTITF